MVRALYRLVLHAYPAEFRREYAAEMEAIFLQCIDAEKSRRRLPTPLIWARGIADALVFAIRVRHDARIARRGQPVSRRRPQMGMHNLRMALRLMLKQPWFTAAVVGMLALGIGATTAMFSVLHGVLLEPLPFPHADRIVQIWGSRPDRGWDQVSLTEANFWDLHDLNHAFDQMGALHGGSAILTGGDAPEQVSAALVSSGFFETLGVTPIAGSLFVPADDVPGDSSRPVLLSHALWTRRFGADPAIVGRTIPFASGPRTVRGVLPAGSPWLNSADVFVPLVRRANADRGSFEYVGIGRLKPGVTFEAGLADLRAVAKDLERYPQNKGLGITSQPANTWIASSDLRRMLWILLGAVSLLLVIACANTTNLLLARASARAWESAVRGALGATRGDLVRQWLTEALIFSAAATGVGLILAVALLGVMRAVQPGGIPRLADVTINPWVFAFSALLALVVGVATGLAPAFHVPNRDLIAALRPGQRGTIGDRGQSRMRTWLVGAEVALSLLLLVGAGLLVRSLTQVLNVDRGFQTDRRLLVTLSIPASYGEPRMAQTITDVMTRIRAMPEIIASAAVSGRPLSRGSTGLGFAAADRPDTSGVVPWATWRIVSKDYFRAMAVPLLSGRGFTDDDEMGKPWRAIISRRIADMLWPGENPVGRTIVLWKGQGDRQAEVIGVVGDMRERGLEADPTLAVYFPAGRSAAGSLQLVLHTRTSPEAVVPALRAAIASVDRNLPLSNAQSLEDVVSASLGVRRFTMLLLVCFASLALVLALAGVYGVLAYSIARRTNEIGVRLALGARHRSVLRLAVLQGMRPVIAGLLVGLAASLLVTRLMSSLLFGIQPTDPLTYVTVMAALLLTAALSCYLPARAVLRVDPVVALRTE